MSIDLKLPFAEFLFASLNEIRKNGFIPKETWLEEVTRCHEVWTAARKPKKKPRIKDEAEWLATLKADPFLKGVDFDTELAACQYWCRNKVVLCSRMRVENWMKRAARDAKVASPGGAASHAPKPNPGPVGWQAWTVENLPGWMRHAQGPLPEWDALTSTERNAILAQMKGPK